MTPNIGSGSLRDFRAMYRAHHGLVWHALHRFGVEAAVIEDAVQDVFVVAYRRREEFLGASTKAWLYGIARRVASNYRRSDRRHEQRVRSVAGSERRMNHDARVAIHLLDSYLSALTEDDREIFLLSELEGMTGPEIAEACGRNVNTVYTRIGKLRRDLHDRLGDVERARTSRPRASVRQWSAIVPLLRATVPATLGKTGLGVAIGAIAASLVLVVADRVLPPDEEDVVAATVIDPVEEDASAPSKSTRTRAEAEPEADAEAEPEPESEPDAEAEPETETVDAAPSRVMATNTLVEPSPEPVAKSPMADPPRDDLAVENKLLGRAADAMAEHRPADALEIANEHARRFPGSPLADLGTALRIEALCELGKVEQARGEARLFVTARPDSPVVHRISRTCGSLPRKPADADTSGA